MNITKRTAASGIPERLFFFDFEFLMLDF